MTTNGTVQDHPEDDEGLNGFLSIGENTAHDDINSEEFLAKEDVSGFVDFLKRFLENDGARIRHCYRHVRDGYDWQCDGLLDAARRYRFKVVSGFRHLTGEVDCESLVANAIVLDDLGTRLRNAIASGNEAAAIQAAIAIQDWGGTNRGDHNESAIRHLSSLPGGFLGYLNVCRLSFGGSVAVSFTPFVGSGYGLRSNAGFTKIYALAFSDFIIYDSRVAAALGLMIVRYWIERCLVARGVVPIPPALALFCMPEYGNHRRDPNANLLAVGRFPSGTGPRVYRDHLMSNIRANWLLTAALRGSNFEHEVSARPHPYPVSPLRALEAALFMIGYDLSGNWPHIG